MRRVSLLLAPALIASTVGVGIWGATTAASAAALPDPSTSIGLVQTGGAYGDADTKPFILAGEDATFDVSITNTSTTGGFNASLTVLLPSGIDFVSSGGMGSPLVYPSGAQLPNSAKTQSGDPLATVPAGMQLWVFQDVADLPGTATYPSSLTVRPDADLFPVGAAPDITLTGYISADPALIPVFDGSTGVGGTAGAAETSGGASSTDMPVHALRLTKHEPSPEIELLRGVHDHQTVYTLTVENSPQGDTNGVTLVDFLPAGLEFLACASVDNTADSPLLYDGSGSLGGSLEYPTAGPITGASPADCLTPASVETVNTGIPAGLDPGVYTKVTWNLPNLTGGTAQTTDLSAPGVAGTYVIRYVAAVPLFENTMDFVTTAGSGTPDPAGLQQASNLNNNNGASTRQGQGAGFGDGILYDNLATAAGTYVGPLAPSTPAAASDTDTEQIQAMDLRVLKSVATGAGSEFITGGLATYTLNIATSEYTSAGDPSDPDPIELVDTLDNGLCPALPGPATAALTGDPLPSDCPYPWSSGGESLTGATATAIDYDSATGTFAVTYLIDPAALTANDEHVVTYTALMRSTYDTDNPWVGPTTSGDSLGNTVTITGWTDAIAALTGVTNGSGVPADGTEDVWDDSEAMIDSAFSAISKQVLPRDSVIPTPGVAPTAAASCDVAPGAPWAQNQTDAADAAFYAGDVVCYELTVVFANEIDVRNPLVTDFLPAGVSYLDSAIYSGSGGTSGGVTIDSFSQNGQRLEWQVGAVGAGGDRYVPLNSRLVLHVLGLVTSNTPSDSSALDKPQNLMKYQQENVLGDLFFLRDASEIQLGQGPTLLKGVRDVDGDATLPAQSQNNPDGTVFDSNRDGIQVAAGDVVTYRVDLSGGDFDADLTVWDALPSGIDKSDVTAISNGGAALDPGDPGYPSDLESSYSGRSIIAWTGIAVAAAPGTATLTYDVTIPADARVNVDYDNTASITQYDVDLNTGDTQTLYPADSLDDTTRPVNETVPGANTRDDSSVFTPDPTVDKQLVSTEVGPNTGIGEQNLDPNNGSSQAVEGELITFDYSVSVPAHTTVTNAVLKDRGTLLRGSTPIPYTVHGTPTWTASALTGATAGDFSLSGAGALTFPASYSNTSNDAQVFTVTLTLYVGDAGNTNSTLTNRALFTSDTWNGQHDASVVYIEPSPQITKSASPASDLTTSDTITYTVSVANTSNRPISYDNVIVDTVPAGLIVDIGSASVAPAAYDVGVTTGAGGTITWNVAEIPPTATFTYEASIDPSTGGGESYTNTVTETGYTLPTSLGGDVTSRRGTRTSTDDATVTAVTAEIAKGVRTAGTTDAFTSSVSEPLGETVEYQVQVTLKANINYYDPVISDDLPAGVVLQDATISGPTASPSTGVTGTWDYALDAGTNTATWTYSDGGGNDILSQPVDRVLTLTYEVLLDGGAVAANITSLPNTAAFAWNTTNDDPSTKTTIDDGATVTVLNPLLGIVKTVSDATPNPGETFDYTVTVTNSGTTPAYNMIVSDDIPTGVVVDPTTITGGGALTGADPVLGGGTITWDQADLPGPLSNIAPGNTVQFTYSATLTASANLHDADTFTNTASVDHYESFPTDGRDYDPTDVDDTATVDPALPDVALTKAVTAGDLAYAGTPFSWTITATNNGDGPAQTVDVVDTLPVNWEMDAVTSVTVAGSAVSPAPDPTVTGTGDSGDPQKLAWSFGTASPASAVLQPGQSIVIVFTAIPRASALVDAGVTQAGPPVVHPPHTNTVSATTTDTSGATGDADGDYTGPDATAEAFIHSADLQLQKDPGTGLVAGGSAGTAWTITVTNNGPDDAVGPFTVSDTWGDAGVLPAGFSVTGVSGTGWDCALVSTTGFDCSRTDSADTLASGASFPVITVTAQAAASFDVADSPVDNTATVTGATHDPDTSNNTDDAEVPVTAEADLVMDKTASSPVNAGGSVTWTLTVTNDGPSDSVSTTAKPITVTDKIPEGMQGTTFGTLPAGWTASAPGPFAADQTVTFTLANGERLTAGQVTAFTLTGTIDPSWPASTGISNTGTVTPGETTDPDPSNNENTETVTPGIDTTLGINKTRVIFDGSAWVPATAANPVVPGEPVTYLVEVTNTGTADARSVTVDDEVADYFTYQSLTSVTGTWTRTTSTSGPGDDQTFALTGDLAAGGSASFRVTLLLDAAVETGATIENTVIAHADNATNDPDDTDSTSDSERSADLSIAKTHTGTVHAGDPLEYTVTVTNNGPSASSGPIEITDTLPSGFGYQTGSATVSVAGGAATATEPVVAGQTLTWTVGDSSSSLANGATIVIVFSATTDSDLAAGSYTNEADVDGPDDDNPSNNHAEDPTTLDTLTNLVITKTPDAGPYIAGTDVGYTLTIENEGPSVARDVVVTDATPVGMTVTAMSGSGWTCDVTVTPAACEIADLPVGTTTISVTAALSASVLTGTDLTNTATVATSTPETSTSDNSDDATITVETLADLGIVKTAVDEAGDPVTTAIAGDEARYLLEVHNYGPSNAVAPVTIVDTLPEGITFVSLVDGTDWSAVADPVDPVSGTQTVTLTRLPSGTGLAAGADAPDVTLIVQLDPSIPVDPVTGTTVLTNSATVSSGTPEPTPDPHSNTDTADLEVSQAVNLSIVKTHDASDVRIGDNLPFDLAVHNDGPSTATGVTVVDTIPAGLVYVDAAGSDPAWTVVADPVAPDGTTTVTATLTGDLAPATDAPTLSLTVTVTAAAYDEVINVGVVSADQPETDPTDNTSDDTVTVPPQSTLVVTKTALGGLQVGSKGTYVIAVTNDGPTEDPGPIVVTDVLPRGLTFVSATSASASCDASGQTVTCTVTGPLGVGETASITLVVKVGNAAYPEVTNTVTVTTPTEQLLGSSLTASTTNPVAADPLAGTGGSLPWWLIMATLLLLVAGGGFLAASRRQTGV